MITEEETPQYLNTINFLPIVNRLIKEKGWLKEEALEIIELYKRFLFLEKKYGDRFQLAPTIEIDQVWHAHILYTKEYHHQCLQLFGKYIHHQPEETMSPSTLDSKDFDRMFNDTQQLYFKEFGEYIPVVRSYNFIGSLVVFVIKLYRWIVSNFQSETTLLLAKKELG